LLYVSSLGTRCHVYHFRRLTTETLHSNTVYNKNAFNYFIDQWICNDRKGQCRRSVMIVNNSTQFVTLFSRWRDNRIIMSYESNMFKIDVIRWITNILVAVVVLSHLLTNSTRRDLIQTGEDNMCEDRQLKSPVDHDDNQLCVQSRFYVLIMIACRSILTI
jgi:hypothetical protein